MNLSPTNLFPFVLYSSIQLKGVSQYIGELLGMTLIVKLKENQIGMLSPGMTTERKRQK